ncbi:sigma-54 interaction domain-containing protein [Massilia sp. TSP1-1-2]|uniref:sigma-54 interaction domain-containing protein n=1 Tax=Massilia sp. TSP1-1-2 TaxID=2804649 RepID=UPI003CF107EE
MANRKLLCVGDEHGCCALLPDWELHAAATLAEAARLLRTNVVLTGLLFLPRQGGAPGLAAIDRFLRHHWQVQWVGVADAATVRQSGFCELAAEHLYDYHTLPLDPPRLRHILGHAHGLALLHSAAPAPHVGPMALTGASAAITRLRVQIRKIAGADAPVLIWGESGSGKELAAQAIHSASARAGAPFVPINCGAIPAALIQSELFGHARGAFTGAARDKVGLIESAGGGTVFLDEIADLPKDLQSNLLRFLQEKTIYRIGSTRSIAIDVRVVAASHVNLQQAVLAGQFREDLYYRLNVLPLTVPPLRERRDDLVALAEQFFHAYAIDKPPRLKGFSAAARRALCEHDWPGNVRELINRVRRALVLAEGRLIGPHDLGLPGPQAGVPDAVQLGDSRSLAERAAILASLERSGGNVTHAARELAISRMTLYRQMAKHGIAPDAP